MILTRSIYVRLAVLGLLTVVVQLSFASGVGVLGAHPDFAVLVVISLGLLAGSLPGAVAGFVLGLVIDTLLFETIGASALALLTAGYVAGRYRETLGKPTRLVTAGLGGGLTLVSALVFASIQAMLRIGADVSPLVARDILITSLLGALLMPPVHAGVRRLLRPALIDEAATPRARRPVAPSPVEEGLR